MLAPYLIVQQYTITSKTNEVWDFIPKQQPQALRDKNRKIVLSFTDHCQVFFNRGTKKQLTKVEHCYETNLKDDTLNLQDETGRFFFYKKHDTSGDQDWVGTENVVLIGKKIHSGRSDKNTENALREILPTLDKVINANPIYIYILHPVKSKQT